MAQKLHVEAALVLHLGRIRVSQMGNIHPSMSPIVELITLVLLFYDMLLFIG
jgi:hypothetical protein